MTLPRISVITINRNTGDTVKRTIASIMAQDIPLEWVVVDGASSDHSLSLLREALRPGDRFISEPDRGISDAFNKGIALASGDAIIYMNAGDAFASPTSLRELATAWDRNRHRWITGTAAVTNENDQLLYVRQVRTLTSPLELVRQGCRIFHQATLVERSLFTEHGGFNESFRISMDYELWLRWFRQNIIPQIAPITVCRYQVGGISGNTRKRLWEDRKARVMHNMVNPWSLDLRLRLLAELKTILRGRTGAWAYRLKERLQW